MHEEMQVVEGSFFDIARFNIPFKNLNGRDTGFFPAQQRHLIALGEQHLRQPLADEACSAGD